MQIITLTLTYISMILVFCSLMILIKLDKQEKRKKCMMNHPAGRHVLNEHSPIGKTQRTLAPYGLMGPVAKGTPTDLEGDF